ncbi:MAG TPA: FTR1 family protein [Candidatus Binatia bacterium]|nr:FTR1 family protein [Candidatus Binatia bacterium]
MTTRRRILLGLAVLAAVFALAVGRATATAATEGRDDVASLRATLDQARDLYASDPTRARELAGDAFLRFESSGLDKTLASRDPSAYKTLESTWLKLVSAMRAGAPRSEIASLHESLVGQLAGAAPRAAGGAGALFANALVIILREGFEAILILSAVAAALRSGGRPEGLRPLALGAGVAVVASLALAAGAAAFGGFGAHGELIEAITCLVAVVVLFLTSYWLISRVEGRRWQKFIRDAVARAAAEDRRGSLFALAFLVVFREGFETVLFYQALALEGASIAGGTASVAGGLVLGLVLLALLWAGITWFGLHVPVRQFFTITGALLYLLAINFAGVGIRELQEAGWLTPAPVAWFPEVAWLRDWLGVVPDAQVLAAQGVLVVAVLAGLVVSRLRGAGDVPGTARHAA